MARRLGKEMKRLAEHERYEHLRSYATVKFDPINILDIDIVVKSNRYERPIHFTVKCPAEYPFKPPAINFGIKKLWHPNVEYEGGVICTDLVDWGPTKNIGDIVKLVSNILCAPSLDNVVNAEAALEYTNNKEGFYAKSNLL